MKLFPVLMYHSISRTSGPLRKLGVSPELLADQLGLLRSHGYELVGLTEALELTAIDPFRAVVALTFDDGYRDFLDAAVPALEAVGARATLYVPTRFIGGTADWLGTEAHSLPPLLSWSELRDCVDTGCVEIGSHSHTHSQLDTLPVRELHTEIVQSKMLLEDGLQVPVKSFCYPHGYHSRPVREAVRGAEYDNACEVGRRLRTAQHRWTVSRLAVEPQHAPKRVLSDVASGGPLVVPRAKRALQPAWRRVRLHSSPKRWPVS
ncbi:MAG TPA: polysaccharide deacetylase family protein [Solirubrobacteraceae bacterium]|jgi:peptidoglycan/xylan/chitin deacetylase (PgdA/CDA1 family)|nr:polysaccharide deacetylase family protein [Solirubrobacteraceae bacterium]